MSGTKIDRGKRMFIVGYLHGRSSLGNHEPAGREAEAAYERYRAEREAREAQARAGDKPVHSARCPSCGLAPGGHVHPDED